MPVTITKMTPKIAELSARFAELGHARRAATDTDTEDELHKQQAAVWAELAPLIGADTLTAPETE